MTCTLEWNTVPPGGASSIAPLATSARAALAHAQKNNLSIISAVATLVERELSDTAQDRLSRLKAAIDRIAALIDLDLQAQRPLQPRARVAVDDLIERLRERVRDRAEVAQVTLIIDCGGGGLNGDALALEEMLFNLVGNAIEATPAGGTVLVTTASDECGDQIWSIRDSGIGMSPEILRQVGRQGRSFRRGGSGFGIGLAAAIAHAHGGDLVYQSELGRGTLVRVSLRAASMSE